ncbi:MAG: SRPBCC family protein [Bdellovibrionales bacterium]|nr:SRPBCC family protein [Bdellovibrionales bacterium]
MKKVIFAIVVILVVIVGALGIIAPNEFVVEKKLVINRPIEAVFFSLKHFKSHASWNPWTRKDRNIKYEYIGEDGTVGFISKWKGNSDVGEGEEEIREIIENQKIITELRFKKPMRDSQSGYLITTEMYENQTEVTWGMRGNLNFPGNIFFFLFNMNKKLGYDLDEGLRILKAILEKNIEEEKRAILQREKESIKNSVKEITDELKK